MAELILQVDYLDHTSNNAALLLLAVLVGVFIMAAVYFDGRGKK